MEFSDDLEDLVVLLDMDRNKIASNEEYEILEDLITIEDEGIMDISHKLLQRDFDEYVNSLQKNTTILPQSFCRIKRNIKLLDTCRPLTIQVVDCKKFKIFYNDKLTMNLKNRENLGDKFKEILSDKDNDISDDDTIEIDVDIADGAEMEDLIRIDCVQGNDVDINGLTLTQNINTDVGNMNKTKLYDKEIYLQSNLKSNEVNIRKAFDDDIMNKFNFKSGNSNSHNVLKVCGNVNCISISTQRDSSICKPNKIIPHYHERKCENIELFASKITNLQKAKDDNFCKTSQTKNVNFQTADIFNRNNSFLIDSQRIANQIDFDDYNKKVIRKENKNNKKHDISKNRKQTKIKHRPLDKSMHSAKNKDKKINKHTKSIQLNMEMQKKIADMLVTVKTLKNTYSKKSSKKSINFADDAVEWNNSNVCQNQMNTINVMPHTPRPHIVEWHQDNFIKMSNTQINNSILSNSVHGINTNFHIQKQQLNKTLMLSSLQIPSNNNLHCPFHNNNCYNFPDKYTEKGILSKSLSSINFMKPHLQTLAKANENPKSIKIRPIHNYGLSNNIKQQEFGKSSTPGKNLGNTLQNNTTSVNESNQDNDKVNLKKIMKVKDTSYESDLNNSSVVVHEHPTIVKILKNRTTVTQENTQANNVPVAKINENLEQKTVQGSKYDVIPCFHNKKETQELQQRIFLFQNEVPQHIPTLQNRKIVEPKQVFSKPDQGIMEYSNRESATQNISESWRIPLIQKADKETYQTPAHSAKLAVDNLKSSPKQDVKSNKDTSKIIEEPKIPKIEHAKKEIKPTRETEHVKPMLSSTKLPEKSQSPIITLISTYQSPVQGVQVETHQRSPKIVRKTKKEEEIKIEIKQKEVGHVKSIPSIKILDPNSSKPSILLQSKPNHLELTAKEIKKSEKPNNFNLNRTSAALMKVTKKEYSPPVLPIPTFKKTFDILAKLNLISKYRYRRNRSNMFQYATVDQSKILSNRSITKDLEKYSKTLKGDS